MGKYCADCIDMGTVDTKGKYPCNNPRCGYKVVSARQAACSYFTECFNSRRSETEREQMMRTSRDYGYYVMTTVMDILNYPEKDNYISEFAYVKDVIMPQLNGGIEWVSEYDIFGPVIAFFISEEPNRVEFARKLYDTYLKDFHTLFGKNELDKAIEVYQNMFKDLMIKYELMQEPKTLSAKTKGE